MRVDLSLGTLIVSITSASVLLLVSFSMMSLNLSMDVVGRGDVKAPSDEITWKNYRDHLVDIDFANSTQIFNSIYAALRQGPADIHPLGVSYYPAVVPKGTLMYRAGKNEIPDSFEWLAMDHEFSYSFGARFPSYGRKSLQKKFGRGSKLSSNSANSASPSNGAPPSNAPSGAAQDKKSLTQMMTFRATRDMNKFIYLDGASAAKSTTGEMDTQELLYNVLKKRFDGPDSVNKMPERDFAEYICRWGKPLGLDGLIRVEIGFEIVLCDFHKDNIELVSNIDMKSPAAELGLPNPTVISVENGWPIEDGNLVEEKLTTEQKDILEKEDYWQSILENYSLARQFNWLQVGNAHDDGDQRVKLDYRYFISGINRVPMDAHPLKRRLLNEHMTNDIQEEIVSELENILNHEFDYTQSNNWQELFDEFINKFSPMLKTFEKILHNEDRTPEQVAVDITKYSLNFVLRFTATNITPNELGQGLDFAIYQYSRPPTNLVTESDYLIWSAYVNIADRVINTIYNLNDSLMPIVRAATNDDSSLDNEKNSIVTKCRDTIDNLISELNWISLHYKCEKACDWDEICFTPSWGPGPLASGFSRNKDSTKQGFSKHYDEAVGREVIDYNLQCVNIDTLLQQNR